MLREPPLVEMPTAMSSLRAWAINWRRKMRSAPTSLAIAVRLAGSSESGNGGHRAKSGWRKHAIDGEVVGVGRRASVAEQDQLAAALHSLMDGACGIDGFRSDCS